MKNSLLVILICFSYFTIHSQKFDYGIGMGFNQSYPTLENEINTTNGLVTKIADPGFGFSIFTMVMFDMNDKHQLRLDPTIRFSLHDRINAQSSSWNYVRIQPSLSYHYLVKNFDLGTGLQYGYLVNSTLRTNETKTNVTDFVDKHTLDLNFSVGYDLFKYITLELQYSRGLTYPKQDNLVDTSQQQLGELKERQDFLELRVLARINR